VTVFGKKLGGKGKTAVQEDLGKHEAFLASFHQQTKAGKSRAGGGDLQVEAKKVAIGKFR